MDVQPSAICPTARGWVPPETNHLLLQWWGQQLTFQSARHVTHTGPRAPFGSWGVGGGGMGGNGGKFPPHGPVLCGMTFLLLGRTGPPSIILTVPHLAHCCPSCLHHFHTTDSDSLPAHACDRAFWFLIDLFKTRFYLQRWFFFPVSLGVGGLVAVGRPLLPRRHSHSLLRSRRSRNRLGNSSSSGVTSLVQIQLCHFLLCDFGQVS